PRPLRSHTATARPPAPQSAETRPADRANRMLTTISPATPTAVRIGARGWANRAEALFRAPAGAAARAGCIGAVGRTGRAWGSEVSTRLVIRSFSVGRSEPE